MKKTISVFLALIMMITVLGLTNLTGVQLFANAEEVIASGNCGESKYGGVATWSLSESGLLLIQGTGWTITYDAGSAPWYQYRDRITSLDIDVTNIGGYSFYGCDQLKTVTFGSKVKAISWNAFQNCKELTDLYIPDNVNSIASYAFSGCTNLKSVRLSNSIDTINDYVFQHCSSLETVSLPSGLKKIIDSAFQYCTALSSIVIPDGVTQILFHAFYGCTSLADISVPSGIQYIGNGAFLNTAWYNSQPNGIVYLGHYLLGYKGTIDAEIHVKEGTELIAPNAFFNCSILAKITIPDTITGIGESAFYWCRNLSQVVYSGSESQWNLIDNRSINDLSDVEVIFSVITTSADIIDSGSCGDHVTYTYTSDGILTISGSGDMTKNNHSSNGFPWSEYRDDIQSVIIEDGVTSIGNYAFFHCSSLTSVSIPEGIISIGQAAFQDCRALPSVFLPESLTEIKQQAFYFCNTLTEITIPDNTASIGYSAFEFCMLLADISFPESLTFIGSRAVNSTPWYSAQPDGLLYIGKCLYTYKGVMPDHTILSLKQGTETIADKAFEGRSELEQISIPDSMNRICPYAFYHCDGLTEVAIPEQVSRLEEEIFMGCKGLTKVTIPGTITQISNKAFNDCVNLQTVEFTGFKCQWDAIQIASDNDESLRSADIHYISDHIPGVPQETILQEADETHEGTKRITVSCTFCKKIIGETTEVIPAMASGGQNDKEPDGKIEYHAGDMIEFGSYPQTRITAESLIAKLEEAAIGLEWQSLGYEVLDQEPFAFYKDVELDGVRYRAQKYTAYRSDHSGSQGESFSSCPHYINGYQINTTYWFRYEPIQWKILDTENGLLFPEMIVDAQAINKVAYNEDGEPHTGTSSPNYLYADAEHQYYLNNYAHSYIRTWLLDTFTSTAFTEQERTVLKAVEQDNSVAETGSDAYMQYACENTNDAVFLLSYGEAAEETYFADDNARRRAGTDYAKAQGLYHYDPNSDFEYWYLRSPSTGAAYQGYIYDNGAISASAESVGTDIGICPAVTVSLAAYDALNNDSPDVPDEPDNPDQPDGPTSSPYDDFTFSFANGILTVFGNGTLPTVDDLSQTPLAQYAQDCAVIIMEDGNKTVSSGAFAGFEKLSILVVNSPTVLENSAFAENKNLQTVICSETANLSGNPFAAGTDVALYEAKSKPHTGALPANCQALPYSFSDGTLHVEGDAAMDTYGLLDFMAVMCGYYEDINYVKFRSYTSLDIPFYVFNAEQKQYVALEENTLNGVSFSIKIFGEEDWETVTFNYFCAHTQDHDLGSFRLVAQTENGEDVQESSFRIIDQIQTFIKRALKWIVSLLNFMFKVLSSFRK